MIAALEFVAILVSCLLTLIISVYVIKSLLSKKRHKPIKVGVLHSLSGNMKISEQSVVEAIKLAIYEINLMGGLLGVQIKPIICDGKSNADDFKKQAEYLIEKEKVSVIFGCWRSDCRKAVKEIVEKNKHLLIYPLQYEGLESSNNIVYLGTTANQQIIPAIKWAFDNIGKQFYLIGSDYVFPQVANTIIKDQLDSLGGEVVGEQYIMLGDDKVDNIVKDIARKQPDVIINTINGDTNMAFFKSLRKHGILSSMIPTISFSLSEAELLKIQPENVEGDYAVWSYFQSIPSIVNQRFVQRYKDKYGQYKVTSDPMACGYIGVKMWAEAVKNIKSFDTMKVRDALQSQVYYAPSGRVDIDPSNNHCKKAIRIGKISDDRQFDIVWCSAKPMNPLPYPDFRTCKEWDDYLHSLYVKWGNQWSRSDNHEI